MDIPSLALSSTAILISGGSLYWAARSARSADRSASAADRSALAAEGSLAIQAAQDHHLRCPGLTGDVELDNGSYQLRITLDPASAPLTAMEVGIRDRQGFGFDRGVGGVVPVADALKDIPLRAFTHDGKGNPAGLRPGGTASWSVYLTAKESAQSIWLDVTCHADGEGPWTVPVEVPVPPRPTDTFW
jgi:hypothetical protein